MVHLLRPSARALFSVPHIATATRSISILPSYCVQLSQHRQQSGEAVSSRGNNNCLQSHQRRTYASKSPGSDPLELLRKSSENRQLCDEFGLRKKDVHWTFGISTPGDTLEGVRTSWYREYRACCVCIRCLFVAKVNVEVVVLNFYLLAYLTRISILPLKASTTSYHRLPTRNPLRNRLHPQTRQGSSQPDFLGQSGIHPLLFWKVSSRRKIRTMGSRGTVWTDQFGRWGCWGGRFVEGYSK